MNFLQAYQAINTRYPVTARRRLQPRALALAKLLKDCRDLGVLTELGRQEHQLLQERFRSTESLNTALSQGWYYRAFVDLPLEAGQNAVQTAEGLKHAFLFICGLSDEEWSANKASFKRETATTATPPKRPTSRSSTAAKAASELNSADATNTKTKGKSTEAIANAASNVTSGTTEVTRRTKSRSATKSPVSTAAQSDSLPKTPSAKSSKAPSAKSKTAASVSSTASAATIDTDKGAGSETSMSASLTNTSLTNTSFTKVMQARSALKRPGKQVYSSDWDWIEAFALQQNAPFADVFAWVVDQAKQQLTRDRVSSSVDPMGTPAAALSNVSTAGIAAAPIELSSATLTSLTASLTGSLSDSLTRSLESSLTAQLETVLATALSPEIGRQISHPVCTELDRQPASHPVAAESVTSALTDQAGADQADASAPPAVPPAAPPTPTKTSRAKSAKGTSKATAKVATSETDPNQDKKTDSKRSTSGKAKLSPDRPESKAKTSTATRSQTRSQAVKNAATSAATGTATGTVTSAATSAATTTLEQTWSKAWQTVHRDELFGTNDLKPVRGVGASDERVLRAIEAIMHWNDQVGVSGDLTQKWQIGNSSIRELAGCNGNVVKRVLQERPTLQQQIDQHNAAHQVDAAFHNREHHTGQSIRDRLWEYVAVTRASETSA